MDIFLGLLLGLIIGGSAAWVVASSNSKSSIERTIRDLDGKAKGAEASRDAVQKQAAIFQQEIITLRSQIEKFQALRIQLEGQIKTLEAKKDSTQEKINEYLQEISSRNDNNEKLRNSNEYFRSVNNQQESQINLLNDRLSQVYSKFENSQQDLSKLKEEFQQIQRENSDLKIAINVANNKKDNLQEIANSLRTQSEITKREKNEEIESLRQQHQQTINSLKEQMADTFRGLAVDALKQSSQEFRSQANEDFTRRQESIEGIVKPVQDSLLRLDKEIREIEKERTGSYSEIKSQIESLSQLEKDLRQETGNLVRVLRQPIGRRQWGEVILEKVLEISGMVQGIHYNTQVSINSSDGIKRPDIIVNLPGERSLVIDAKAVMSAYLDTLLDSHDEAEREKGYRDHANQLRSRINDLSKKEYSVQFQTSPEFVILFLPAESLFSAALQFDKELLEYAANKNIILATPTTLIALLRTVYYGWKQYEIAKNAEEIGKLGSELHDRFVKMIDHFNNVGKSIKKTGEAFDKTAGSFNAMLRPSFNKLRAKVTQEQGELNEIESLDISPKNFYDLSKD